MPKWMGSMPTAWMTGRNIGVRMMTCAMVFSHIPTKVRKRLMSMRIMNGEVVTRWMKAVTNWGI